jgi:hypothetical protein
MEHLNKTNIDKFTEELEKIIQKRKDDNIKRLYYKNVRVYSLVKDFIKKKNLLIYGGIAVNSILPKKERFYDKYENPDIDFFSYRAKSDAIELVNYLTNKGIKYVEVRSGIHYETFKIYVNFTPIADITDIPKYLFDRMLNMSKKEADLIKIHAPDYDIKAAPLDFLRLAMHIELSRPDGYIDRWMKVFKRMTLLYDYYPVILDKNCNGYEKERSNKIIEFRSKIITILKNLNLPLIGIEAVKLYLQEGGIKIDGNAILHEDMTIFDIISVDYISTSDIIITELNKYLGKDMKIYKQKYSSLNKSELLPKHIIISLEYIENNKIFKRPLITIYKSVACYSYKKINGIMVASIDSNLSFLYAWLLTNRIYLKKNRIRCIMSWLLNIQYRNLHKNKPIFNLFEQKCYGKQLDLDDLRKYFWKKKTDIIVYRPNIKKIHQKIF